MAAVPRAGNNTRTAYSLIEVLIFDTINNMERTDKSIDKLAEEIRNRANPAFEEWAQYGVDPESFIEIVYWLAEETQEERGGQLHWARAVGLTVPHVITRTLGGDRIVQQTGPARLHRLRNEYHALTGLALIHDADTNESWNYHSWPHLTLRDIIDGKSYCLENSAHPHPELEKYNHPDRR